MAVPRMARLAKKPVVGAGFVPVADDLLSCYSDCSFRLAAISSSSLMRSLSAVIWF